MALDSLAKLIGTALLKLGDFAQYVMPHELEAVAYDRLAYYLVDFRESDQNQRLKTLNFDLANNQNSVNVKALAADIHSAAWVEVRVDQHESRERWQVIPTVNLDTLPDYAARGDLACAFSGENINDLTVTFSYYGNPWNKTHRLRYDANLTLPAAIDTAINLPDNLGNVIVYDIAAEIMPYAQMRVVEQFGENELNLALKMKISDSIQSTVVARRDEWLVKWDNFKHDANRSQRGMRRPKYLPGGAGF